MNRTIATLSTFLVVLVAAAPAAAVIPIDPTATISSTKGTGAHGCVTAKKSVAFTILFDFQWTNQSATVKLDGKTITTRYFAVPVSLGSAAQLVPLVHRFSLDVDLRHARSGRHTLVLNGVIQLLPGRHGGAHSASTFTPPKAPNYTGSVVESASISKCAVSKPHFTG